MTHIDTINPVFTHISCVSGYNKGSIASYSRKNYDQNYEGCLFYGSGKYVMKDQKTLFDMSDSVSHVLCQSYDDGFMIVAASVDGSISCYQSISDSNNVHLKLGKLSSSILALDCCDFGDYLERDEDNYLIIASETNNGKLHAWKISKNLNINDSTISFSILPLNTMVDHYLSRITAIYTIRQNFLNFTSHLDKCFLIFLATSDALIQVYAVTCRDENFKTIDHLVLQGHSDWIKSIDSDTDKRCASRNGFKVFTASLDKTIRVWQCNFHYLREHCSEANALHEIVNFKRFLTLPIQHFYLSINPMSVLLGHDAPVNFIKWSGNILLSAALDKSLITWELNNNVFRISSQISEIDNVIMEDVYTNENVRTINESKVVGNLGSTFGQDHISGYYWADIDYDAGVLMAGQSLGSIRAWKVFNHDFFTSNLSSNSVLEWKPISSVISGHVGIISNICWLPLDGNHLINPPCLVSCGFTDRSTRIWGLRKHSNSHKLTIHELSRVQIHGYNINYILCLPKNRIFSASDEKVIRVFDALATTFAERLNAFNRGDHSFCALKSNQRVHLPTLGLTNSLIMEDMNCQTTDMYDVNCQTIPTEHELANSTLWPEIFKLYGHGNEVYRLSYLQHRDQIISACKASKPEDASFCIWNTNGDLVKTIHSPNGPRLTITCIKSSYSNIDSSHHGLILIGSRDRGLYLFEDKNYELVWSCNDAHSRIIWDVIWIVPLKIFASCSRDCTVNFWSVNQIFHVDRKDSSISVNRLCTLSLPQPPTTMTLLKNCLSYDHKLSLLIGCESGSVIHAIVDVNNLHFEIVNHQLFFLNEHITSFAWDEDSKLLAISTVNGTIRFYQMER